MKDAIKLADPSYHDTGTNSVAQLNSPTPITLYGVQEWGPYLPNKPSYCRFSVDIFVAMATGVVLAQISVAQ